MKVSIIGTGDISKISRNCDIDEEQVKKLIEDIGKLIAEKGADIVAVPARGIPISVVQAYKKAGGKKFIGIVPRDDKRYGIKHIEEYLGLVDEEVNIGDWYNLNGEIAAYGDVAVVIGISPGAMIDVCMLKYHYKYLGSKTQLVVFRNTISQPFPPEIEVDLKGINYINSVEELEKFLE